MEACTHGNKDIVKLLLDKDANVHIKDCHGDTVYSGFRAYELAQEHPEILDLLKQAMEQQAQKNNL